MQSQIANYALELAVARAAFIEQGQKFQSEASELSAQLDRMASMIASQKDGGDG